MMLFKIQLIVAFVLVQLWQCNGEDIQYVHKVVSDTKLDGFATSLATSHQRLVISAPKGNYILTEQGVKVRAPQGSWFGRYLDVNQQFIVASTGRPFSAYVYLSTHPYTLLARIPLDDWVNDVKIFDDNTIFVATGLATGYVSVYCFTHHSSWERQQKIVLEDFDGHYMSLAVSNSVLAIGYSVGHSGRVNIFNKVNNQYTFTTTLQPIECAGLFGSSVAMDGSHLVVSSRQDLHNNIIFTYELDPSRGEWMMNGHIVVPGTDYTFVSLQNGILAATFNDRHHNPEVCAYVYKLSSSNHSNSNNANNNNNNNTVSNKTKHKWKKVATLKTNGVAITYAQYHSAISVQDGLIFTGRVDRRGYGMVFVHDISKQWTSNKKL